MNNFIVKDFRRARSRNILKVPRSSWLFENTEWKNSAASEISMSVYAIRHNHKDPKI